VVKVGSSSITASDGSISEDQMRALVDGLAALVAEGVRPVLVTSGAIATGRGLVRSQPSRGDLTDLQALAAVGQGILMAHYAEVFKSRGTQVAQLLLTARDFWDRTSYLNARSTLQRLCAWGIVPIVNENDTTATDEITLGDNDRLSALVATLIPASMLILLTDTAGLYERDPRLDTEASLIEEVTQIDADLENAAGGPGSSVGSGGMATKVAAAKIASWSGIPCTIAAAREPNVVVRAWHGESVGTRVRARPTSMPARKAWIAFARPPGGSLCIDAGAVRALTSAGGSLLRVGLKHTSGDFAAGDVVDVQDENGHVVAKGIVRLGAHDVADPDSRSESARGIVVHRDDMVILADSKELVY
jgi:glutamate 5-kinase